MSSLEIERRNAVGRKARADTGEYERDAQVSVGGKLHAEIQRGLTMKFLRPMCCNKRCRSSGEKVDAIGSESCTG